MFVRLVKNLRGYVKICLEGYSPERFLNLCNANGILIWDAEQKDQVYQFCVGVKEFKKLRPFARKTGTKLTILEKHGVPFFFYKFRKRKLFFAGIILCVGIIYGCSLFVWNIHLEGNISQTNEEILEYMEEIGVRHGSRKSGIRCEEIEKNLRTQYPNMLWVSAELRGTRLIVQIKENEDQDIVSKAEVKDTQPVSIVSENAGTIESMIVRQGTPVVKVGDAVEAGDVLVEGYYPVKNDAGEILRYEGVAADADIYLNSVQNYTDSFSIEYEEKIYTKKKRLGIELTVFDKNLRFHPKIPFEQYEIVEKRLQLHITENFYFPASLTLFWYLEYVPEKKIYDSAALKTLADERYLNKYKNILQKGVQIIEKDVKIYTNGKLLLVEGNVTLRIPVTTKVPAEIPEL